MNEQTETITKVFNNRTLTYSYTQASSLKTYQKSGGYVVYLNSSATDALNRINRFYNDDIFDQNLATLVIESLTYNPNYKSYVLT
jgi:hypothetical protein